MSDEEEIFYDVDEVDEVKKSPNGKEEILLDLEYENSSQLFSEMQSINLETEDNKMERLSAEIKEKVVQMKYESMMDDLKDINVDLDFLKKNLTSVNVKAKNVKESHFHNLFVLQDFQADSQQIWIAKFSFDGRYLATGGKSGVLKIFSVFTEEESLDNYEYKGLISYLKLLRENAYRIYTDHSADIIDMSWNMKAMNLLLTASLDKSVILWNVEQEACVTKFFHSAFMTSVCFSPSSDEHLFVSGCIDKIVRIWHPAKNKVVDYINMQDYITAIAYFPLGDQIVVGSHTGKCSVYESASKLKYSYSFDCKNKAGKHSDGRKVTNFEFLNKNNILISTNDSSIRLVNANDGKTVQKYKGHVNEELMIRAFYEEIYDLVISSSDDGFVYVWKKVNSPNEVKNRSYEYFQSFEKEKENTLCSLFANDYVFSNYIKKTTKVSQKFFLKSVVINTSDTGRLQVLINTDV